jgi:uncharacterized protein (DUF58 family)
MRFIRSIYFTSRLYWAAAICVACLCLTYSVPALIWLAKGALFALISAVIADILMLYLPKDAMTGSRLLPEKLSNSDENDISLFIENRYTFPVRITVIDEIPEQFQKRDFEIRDRLETAQTKNVTYKLRPTKRGEYTFGSQLVYVTGLIGLVERKYTFDSNKMVPVYPSFLQMRKYELMAIHNRLIDTGIKRIRKIGHTMEFEMIKNYVQGDDYRTINWNATARKSELMVNQFQDEKSQPIYSVIDKGRLMKLPFEGLSLLDYSINATLAFSNIAIKKDDKAGLITFADKMSSIVPADKRKMQMNLLMESLYHQRTNYLESNYELLYTTIRAKVNQRSLIILYTNFESLSSMQRNLKYFQAIAKNHILIVVFFVNTEMKTLIDKKADTVEEIYTKTIAEKFDYEKKQIVKELQRCGISAILTQPAALTTEVINKYLEIKARGII